MKRRSIYVLILVMLTLLAAQCIFSMKQESPVCDEVSHHIATGYSFLKTKDFRLNSTSPPLTEELAALPLLFLNPTLPISHPSWNAIDRVAFGFQFLYRCNNNADQIVFWTRIPMVILSLLCGFLVFIFAKDLYGENAGLFALFLYIFSANIIAYSKLVTPDIGATLFMLLSLYTYYKFLVKPSGKNTVLAGIAFGLAQASKISSLILLPLFIFLSIWKSVADKKSKFVTHTILIFLLGYLTVFTIYFGEIKPLLKNDRDVKEKIEYINKGVDKVFRGDNRNIKNGVIKFAMNTPVPIATYFMNLLADTNMVFVKDYGVFLMGKTSARGWWYYYICVFLLKTPIPFLILLSLVVILFSRMKPSNIWGERIGVSFIFLFSAASFLTKLQLSVRYILPLYPVLFIYVSKLIGITAKRRKALLACILAMSIWYAAEGLSIYPHHLSYFNKLAGGPDNGWRYLRDANIDYGQDLPSLASYMKKYNISDIRLSYFGTADPGYYGISYKPISEEELKSPKPLVYAVSANYIDSIVWKDHIRPTAKAGYSIFIYDLTKRSFE